MHNATLSNYFDYPFGNRTQIPSFRIAVGGGRNFKQKEPIVLPVEITFLCEGASATLVDMDHGYACWFLRRILPDGTQQRVPPIAKAVDRKSPRVMSHRLAHRQSYKRSLDLSAMGDFSKPGTYRIQLVYGDGGIAEMDKGDWVGQFSSSVFEIKVSR